jgi:AraC-like DNA-binding protein
VPYKSKINPEKSKTKILVNQLGFIHNQPGNIWDSRMVDWKDYDLWIILGGRSILRTPESTFNLLPGDCLVLRPWEKYWFKNNTQKRITLFYIHYDYIDSNMDVIPPDKIEPPLFYRHTDELESLEKLIDRIYISYKENNIEDCNFWLETILKGVDALYKENNLPSPKPEQKRIINSLCEEINKYPGNSYKVPELAKKIHYNHDHFSRLFKKYKNISPGKFIIQARIKAAKRLLHLTNEPIGQIADILNYSSSYSFSKQFHKKTGATPSEYRKLVKKG